MRRCGASSRAAAITCPSIARPHTSLSIFGRAVRILVPSPAARTMTAAGPSEVTRPEVTRLGSFFVSRSDWSGSPVVLSPVLMSATGRSKVPVQAALCPMRCTRPQHGETSLSRHGQDTGQLLTIGQAGWPFVPGTALVPDRATNSGTPAATDQAILDSDWQVRRRRNRAASCSHRWTDKSRPC